MAKHRKSTKPWLVSVTHQARGAGHLARREARHAVAQAMKTPRLTVGALAVAVASVSAPAVSTIADAPTTTATMNIAASGPGAHQHAEESHDDGEKRETASPGRHRAADPSEEKPKESAPEPAPEKPRESAPEPPPEKPVAPERVEKAEPKPEPEPPAPPKAPKPGIDGWIEEATEILVDSGTAREKINAADIRMIIKHESGGDPKSINRWDSNARRGTPSKGLMQCIDPTFGTHSLPGHKDIYDPVDNIIAGVRYAVSRYGSTSNVPGVKAKRNGGSYRGY